jgi:hypothetical protein
MPRLSKVGAAALAAFGWTTGASGVTATYLVVAGGGGGGGGLAGGGGAGGLLTGTASLNPTLSYTVTVGAGGSAGIANTSDGVNGSNSVFNSITSIGGGGGASVTSGGGTARAGLAGGSGGGSSGATGGSAAAVGAGTSGQGNNGGAGITSGVFGGGGGGGAGAVGATGKNTGTGAGGNGLASSISGSSVTYAGGGGGGSDTTAASGGTGGGGNSGAASAGVGVAGTANTGGGGGGGAGGGAGGNGGSGGSGIVIISYVGAQQFGGGVVTSSGGNTIHTFTTSGTLVPVTPLSASYLVVAGGGGGGGRIAGGGGAGGLLAGSGVAIDTNSIYLVTVGSGGSGGTNTGGSGTRGVSGSNSAFLAITSTGGGGGGNYGSNDAGLTGGSGGGGSGLTGAGGSGTSGQGNSGGTGSILGNISEGGGGGGASAAGSNGDATGSGRGNGGAGTASSISGSSVTYAGGGGSGAYFTGAVAGDGGAGGGGAGSIDAGATGGTGTTTPAAGTANTGGGGGGNGVNASGNGGNGGSGVVIISYAGATQLMAGGTVTISGGNVIHTFTSTGYLTPLKYVGNSLRFRSSASAYLNRTPSVASNRKTFTFSFWMKLGALGTTEILFSAGTGGSDSSNLTLGFSANQFSCGFWNFSPFLATQLFRDPAAWYHIVVAFDTTQATATNRVLPYINGNLITAFTTDDRASVTQNMDLAVNNTTGHNIGRNIYGSNYYFDGYLAEFNFIDGQQLTPNSFGTFNSYGVWQPIIYGGSYGTNGFYLPFTNNASTTTLGYDFSPNGNNWTTNNISLTAGTTYDSMTDVPTLTSATAANYAVLNAINKGASGTGPANGNLSWGAGGHATILSTIGASSGQWYAEFTLTTSSAGGFGITSNPQAENAYSNVAGKWWIYDNTGSFNIVSETTTTFSGASRFTTNQVWQVALDITNGKCFIGIGNSWVDSAGGSTGNPSTGANPTFTFTAGTQMFYMLEVAGCVWAANFGQRAFSNTPPTGYVALNTYNL